MRMRWYVLGEIGMIALAITAGVLATISGSVSLTLFWVWLGALIVARLQILIMQGHINLLKSWNKVLRRR